MQVLDVAIEEQRHARVDVLVAVAGHSHQLAHDLRVGLSVEPMVVGSTAAVHLDQRAVDGALAGAIGQQNGSVDVEENELHIRVSKSPPMMQAAPIPCHDVGVSPNIIQATSTAITGCRLVYIAVRVGPITRTPRYQK